MRGRANMRVSVNVSIYKAINQSDSLEHTLKHGVFLCMFWVLWVLSDLKLASFIGVFGSSSTQDRVGFWLRSSGKALGLRLLSRGDSNPFDTLGNRGDIPFQLYPLRFPMYSWN
jgi:hypothetical protein